MGTARKLLLGAATAWPLVYLAVFTRTLLEVALSGFTPPPELVDGSLLLVAAQLAVHLGTLILIVTLGAWYVKDSFRSPHVPENRRVVWVVLNVVGGFLAQIPYWYLFVWREPEPLPTTVVKPGAPAK
ncbi:MAG TPA: hypothetical protein VIV57_11175 [Anaeromyxobacter sp.]